MRQLQVELRNSCIIGIRLWSIIFDMKQMVTLFIIDILSPIQIGSSKHPKKAALSILSWHSNKSTSFKFWNIASLFAASMSFWPMFTRQLSFPNMCTICYLHMHQTLPCWLLGLLLHCYISGSKLGEEILLMKSRVLILTPSIKFTKAGSKPSSFISVHQFVGKVILNQS